MLFEMLSGQRAFNGEEMSDVLASVLRQELDWTAAARRDLAAPEASARALPRTRSTHAAARHRRSTRRNRQGPVRNR